MLAVKLLDSALLNLINWITYDTSVHSFVSDCHCNEPSQPLTIFQHKLIGLFTSVLGLDWIWTRWSFIDNFEYWFSEVDRFEF